MLGTPKPREEGNPPHRFTGKRVMIFDGISVFATALLIAWWVNQYLYAATFSPIQLTQSEQHLLDNKMAKLSQGGQVDFSSSNSKVVSSEGIL